MADAVKHTPGPWNYGHVGTDALWIGPDYNQTPVAHVDHDMEYARDNSQANARLIAAAPELLDIVQALLKLHEAHHNTIEHSAARKAVAKATGAA